MFTSIISNTKWCHSVGLSCNFIRTCLFCFNWQMLLPLFVYQNFGRCYCHYLFTKVWQMLLPFVLWFMIKPLVLFYFIGRTNGNNISQFKNKGNNISLTNKMAITSAMGMFNAPLQQKVVSHHMA